MRSRRVLVVAAVMALTLGTAQTALADNNATGSVGAVQTGPVASHAERSHERRRVRTAAASVPVAVGGQGNNTATNSVGAVQAGGGNTSSNSTGSVQVERCECVTVGVRGCIGLECERECSGDDRR